MINDKPTYLNFDKGNYAWKPDIDYRLYPEKYKVGKGEQGVLICEPYKSEIGKHWRFKNPEIAKVSSEMIFSIFLDYLEQDDFVGADLARKYLQMGFTRARRYFNFKGGKNTMLKKDISSWKKERVIQRKQRLRIFFIKNGKKQRETKNTPN